MRVRVCARVCVNKANTQYTRLMREIEEFSKCLRIVLFVTI